MNPEKSNLSSICFFLVVSNQPEIIPGLSAIPHMTGSESPGPNWCFVLFCFLLRYWGLNSGLCPYWSGALPPEPQLHPRWCFIQWHFHPIRAHMSTPESQVFFI
jgi:hypothetical protein